VPQEERRLDREKRRLGENLAAEPWHRVSCRLTLPSGKVLNELERTETLLTKNERAFKKTVREEELRYRQSIASQVTAQKRRVISSNITDHAAERDAALRSFARFAGL
jgi:hypothetical protein